MTIASGTRLGPYEITDQIGTGGMGQVYRARDTRLDRIVAIKVLPLALASTPGFRERFEREARAIAALSHPHICTLYDVGRHDATDYLVLEYLRGETLADRLTRGPLPVEQALQLGTQIADALTRAHSAGIIHRDLKPGNIMLTTAGAKLLDFGLAKAAAPPPTAPSATLLPTTPPNLTMQGMLLGTSHYMAPEQVEGNDADARTDVFALGVVLYEMLTGTRPFVGKSLAHLHAAILEHEPEPLSVRQPSAPPALVRTIAKCLAKNPEERWQSTADLRDELRWIAQHDTTPAATPDRRSSRASRSARVAWLVAAVLGVAAIGFAAAVVLRPEAEIRGYQVELAVPAPDSNNIFRRLAISPDGHMLAFTAPDGQGKVALFVRDLASGVERRLPGTEGAVGPFWSPDSRNIAFAADRELKRIDAAGGSVERICWLPMNAAESFARGAWNRDGTIIFGPSGVLPLWRVDVGGATAQPSAITHVNAAAGDLGHRFPSFLPDQRRFVYIAHRANGSRVVNVGSLDTDEQTRLIEDVVDVQVASDHLLFVRETTLWAQRFDPTTLSLSGQPIQIAEDVLASSATLAGAVFSASSAGELVYQPGAFVESSRIVWMNREGTVTSVVAESAPHQDLFLSHDARFASVSKPSSGRGSTRDIWVVDTSNGRQRKLTVDSGNEFEGIWSSMGDRILYNSNRKGALNLYARSSSGAGTEEEILADGVDKFPQAWSPDGEYAIYLTFGDKTGQDLWLLPMRTRRPEPLLNTDAGEPSASFSPDGRWILYWQRGHVWVMPFRRPGGPWQVSTEAGGNWPRWSQGGAEVIYISRGMFMSAAMNCGGDSCEAESVRPLFERAYYGPGRWSYGVAPDGQRILALVSDVQTASRPLTLLVNWPARLTGAK
jgi:Tol biopolymer transport system component